MAARAPIGRRWHLSAWQTLLCVLAALAIALGGLLAWREARSAAMAVAWVQHTFSVLLQAEKLLQLMVDAETAQRGFLLTGEAAYLEPYEAAVPQIRPAFDALRESTGDNVEVQTRLSELAPTIDAKLQEMEETIRKARTDRRAAAIARVTTDEGKRSMDEIRRGIAGVREQEAGLLRGRLARRDEFLRGTRDFALALGVVSSGILAALIASINYTLGRRIAAERATRESEQRLRVTLESIGDAVIATDVAGNVTYLNPVAEALTGWRRDEARSLPLDQIFRIVNELSRDVVESPVSKVIREGGIVGLANHTLLIARDGSERPIDDSGAPIRDADGALMGVVLVFRDVSARRLSEQARERLIRAESARDSAESASQAKDEFLAIVSHELRSPIAAALSWVELLQGGTLPETDRVRAVATIERNLRHQALLVSDLLDVSRIVAGKLVLERVPADAAAIVREAVDDHRTAAESNGIALRHQSSGPIIAMVDPDRLRQVLVNLLSNALRFTPEGGAIDVSLVASERDVEISVADTGRGIPATFLPHVFERFRQADSSVARAHGGLGLGLSIARHLVERHGGSISAASDGEGRGAVFRLLIPIQEQAPQGAAPSARAVRPDARLDGVTLLLVEDHTDTRDALAYRLRGHGARVLVAGSAAEALKLFREEPPSLIISDLGLPQESGVALIEQLRAEEARNGHTRTPAIAASGFASGIDRRAALSAGFDAYLTKPVDFAALLARIATLLARDI